MQFLGQLRGAPPGSDRDDLLVLFMCQNDPGLCEQWDATAGGNAVAAVSDDDLQLAEAPSEGRCAAGPVPRSHRAPVCCRQLRGRAHGMGEANGRRPREVLGQMGGEPAWIQQDETPSCDACGQPMTLAAQLEQGPDAGTEMNFGGGGCAYVFRCRCDAPAAKMLSPC